MRLLAALFSWQRGMIDAGRDYAVMLEEQIDTMEGMVREAADVLTSGMCKSAGPGL